MRLFVALFPPKAVVDLLSDAVQRFRGRLSKDAVRWTPPAQIHLTLNFIGAVEASRAQEFSGALRSSVDKHARFAVRAAGAGCFPSVRQPRILWAGLEGDLEAMEALKVEVDRALLPLGYVPEERKFHPHLTLGRVNRLGVSERSAVAEWIDELGRIDFGGWEADRIQLMQSVLAPTGAKYTEVQAFELGEIG